MVAKVTPRWGDFGHFYEFFLKKGKNFNLAKIRSYTLKTMKFRYKSPVINNTLKVLQTVVLSLDEQYVTNLRFTALENTLRAILNVCFKIV